MSFFQQIKYRLKSLFMGDHSDWVEKYPEFGRDTKAEITQLCDQLLSLTDHTIFGGPFAGMKLHPESGLCREPNIILGSYESELHDLINRIIASPPGCIVDIGTSHGLYVVGLALYIADTPIVGFELREELWPQIRQLASTNQVSDRINVFGECTKEGLNRVLKPGGFVICDCEGAELELLDPAVVTELRSATICCELHDFLRSRVTPTLVSRFKGTHKIEILCETPRYVDGYRILRKFPKEVRHIICDETRHRSTPFMLASGRFMVLTPRNGTAAG
jgi:hypothetical protein